MRRSLVGLVLTIGVGGCSVVTDLSELTPRGGDAVVSETGAPDVGGGEDAVADGDAAPARAYCAQLSADWGYDYCRDFDDAENILFEWDSTKISSGGSITRDSANAFSAPGAFLAKLDPAASACSDARVERKVEKSLPDHLTVHFRLRLGSVSAPDTDYSGSYMTVRLGEGASPCDLVFSGDATSGKITESSGTTVEHPFALRWPAQRTWTHVQIDVDRMAKTFLVTVDGKEVYSAPRPLGAACAASGSVVVAPGISCHDAPTAPAEVRIDNLVVAG